MSDEIVISSLILILFISSTTKRPNIRDVYCKTADLSYIVSKTFYQKPVPRGLKFNPQSFDCSAQNSLEKDADAAANEILKNRFMSWGEGFVHSLYVAALQRPEPKAHDTRTKLFVILETIFALLQAALLALAIRRKFMR